MNFFFDLEGRNFNFPKIKMTECVVCTEPTWYALPCDHRHHVCPVCVAKIKKCPCCREPLPGEDETVYDDDDIEITQISLEALQMARSLPAPPGLSGEELERYYMWMAVSGFYAVTDDDETDDDETDDDE